MAEKLKSEDNNMKFLFFLPFRFVSILVSIEYAEKERNPFRLFSAVDLIAKNCLCGGAHCATEKPFLTQSIVRNKRSLRRRVQVSIIGLFLALEDKTKALFRHQTGIIT